MSASSDVVPMVHILSKIKILFFQIIPLLCKERLGEVELGKCRKFAKWKTTTPIPHFYLPFIPSLQRRG
jgi:hypothetical protein